MRKIRYKEAPESLSKMAAPDFNSKSRSSIGMESFVGEYFYIEIDKLIPYENQSRVIFDNEELEQLASTIKEHGIRQPLTVIKSKNFDGKFEVVSGERRLRASTIAGLEKLPCIIIDGSTSVEEIALIENIQRKDLHPLELARGLNKLLENYRYGEQAELSKKLGIPNSRISESLSLLSLPDEIQDLILEKNFTGRDKLIALLKCKSLEEMKSYILGTGASIKAAPSFSVLRVSFNNGDLKVQNNAFKKLSSEQKSTVINSLKEMIELLES